VKTEGTDEPEEAAEKGEVLITSKTNVGTTNKSLSLCKLLHPQIFWTLAYSLLSHQGILFRPLFTVDSLNQLIASLPARILGQKYRDDASSSNLQVRPLGHPLNQSANPGTPVSSYLSTARAENS
jgi:hypothetical protein